MLKPDPRIIEGIFSDAIQLAEVCRGRLVPDIGSAAALLVDTLSGGGKILACGNGGSAADAQHFSAELMNRFEIERPPLAALALNTDTSTLTSVANDYHFDEVFAKQVAGLGRPGDALVAFTTSGSSPNISAAVRAARRSGLRVILLSGKSGQPAAGELGPDDIEIRVPSQSTARIQEVHGIIIHCFCTVIDNCMFGEGRL